MVLFSLSLKGNIESLDIDDLDLILEKESLIINLRYDIGKYMYIYYYFII